ncbi:hypothetical protein PAHAL_8G055800 [Panicum hallii]|uniref:Uncharacterized protein n=1 Tax=Panicum hallii TaxID=206008 RepID=A0A2S3ICZ5_9POAL|nr:uncharacterized protein LOC112901878 [Panicum hallii]PAN41592.1 hypothetical protein PAHAL_8G055800 [Panicum hallii]
MAGWERRPGTGCVTRKTGKESSGRGRLVSGARFELSQCLYVVAVPPGSHSYLFYSRSGELRGPSPNTFPTPPQLWRRRPGPARGDRRLARHQHGLLRSSDARSGGQRRAWRSGGGRGVVGEAELRLLLLAAPQRPPCRSLPPPSACSSLSKLFQHIDDGFVALDRMPLQEDDRGMPLQEDDRGRLIVARFRWLQEIVGDQIHAASAAVLEKIPQDSEVVFAVLDVSLDLNLNEGLREQDEHTGFCSCGTFEGGDCPILCSIWRIAPDQMLHLLSFLLLPGARCASQCWEDYCRSASISSLLVLWIHGLLRLRIQ